ncbi:MAG: helix-turn-helix domain-containing protein [Alphaproteobacteria bacterium]|nr:helix-turn-helix domain-containing protein [Alphaproteobacteria bacterium]
MFELIDLQNERMKKRARRQRLFLREWRKAKDVTQEQLAERIGVNRSYVSAIESGARQYNQQFLEAAAEALGLDPADLIVRNPADPNGYWTVWDGIPPGERPRFAAAIEALKVTLRKTGT